jgi:putative ATP-dependent endonuclease of OLD family
MRLRRIIIKNFRRLGEADIELAPASFVIGQNNWGKSSVLSAVEALLSLKNDIVSLNDFRKNTDGTVETTLEITGYLSGIDNATASSRGFKGRVINGEFIYKKTFYTTNPSKPTIEALVYPSTIKQEFANSKKIQDLIDLGISIDTIKEVFDTENPEEKLKKNWEKSLPEVLNFDTTATPTWEINPGGVPPNVVSRLPKPIRVPSITDINQIESDKKTYIMAECLSLLFEDLLNDNPLKNDIQTKLNELESQMDPDDDGSLIKILMQKVNEIIAQVFPSCGITIKPNLKNVTDILNPKYDINLFSNITTNASNQGTGLLRTTIFAMLKYHSQLKLEKKLETRPILVEFEEPELYLHPAAANLLRDTIHSLGQSDQIICNTHSPWMIDLTKEPLSLIKMVLTDNDSVTAINYGVSSAFLRLPPEDKIRVKMLQVFDDELSRVFFSEKVIVVEGDSEYLALHNTIKLFDADTKKLIQSKYQIVRARGKASIISLVKYLQDLGINPRVMHDRDQGVAGSEVFNNPISEAVDDDSRLVVLEECVENALGYPVPSYDKPFKAFKYSNSWNSIADIPTVWKIVCNKLFEINLM